MLNVFLWKLLYIHNMESLCKIRTYILRHHFVNSRRATPSLVIRGMSYDITLLEFKNIKLCPFFSFIDINTITPQKQLTFINRENFCFNIESWKYFRIIRPRLTQKYMYPLDVKFLTEFHCSLNMKCSWFGVPVYWKSSA